MKQRPEQPSEKASAWQREFFEYLDDVVARRLAERGSAELKSPAGLSPAETASERRAAADLSSAFEGGSPGPTAVQASGATVGGPLGGGPAGTPMPSGVGEFDTRLGGGFFPGLWMVAGDAGGPTRAFFESIVWEAVSDRRTTLYFSLTEGAEALRARLGGTLARIMVDGTHGDSSMGAEWHSADVLPADIDDPAWRLTLSCVWVTEVLPVGAEPVGSFLRDLECTLTAVAARVGHAPLVFIDDLEALLVGLGVERGLGAARVVTGLNGVVVRCGSPCLMTVSPEFTRLSLPPDEATCAELSRLGHGLLRMVTRSTTRVDVTVAENPHAAWRGTLPLALHSDVGMFTLAD